MPRRNLRNPCTSLYPLSPPFLCPILWSLPSHTLGKPSGCMVAQRHGRPCGRISGRRSSRPVPQRTARPFAHVLVHRPVAVLFRHFVAWSCPLRACGSLSASHARSNPDRRPDHHRPRPRPRPKPRPQPRPNPRPNHPSDRPQAAPVRHGRLSVRRGAIRGNQPPVPEASAGNRVHVAGNGISGAVPRRAARHRSEPKRSCSITCWHRCYLLARFSECVCLLPRICGAFSDRPGVFIREPYHAETHPAPGHPPATGRRQRRTPGISVPASELSRPSSQR